MEYDDYKLEIEIIKRVTFKRENLNPINMKYYELSTGILFISLKDFEGFMFYDQYKNFYNTIEKKFISKIKVLFLLEIKIKKLLVCLITI